MRKKNATFQRKKIPSANFSRFIEFGKTQVTIYESPKGFVTVIEQVIRSFLYDLRGRRKQFLKKGYFADEKHFWLIFSRFLEHQKPQKTIYDGSLNLLTVIMEVIRSFLEEVRGCWK